MSLLLEARQKASKNHVGDQGMTASVEADDLRDLSLEPLADTRPGSSSASVPLEPELTEPPASPEYATDVLQANDTPRYSALNWVQDHHMLSFMALAALFAIGYGLYVYIQVSNPGMFRSSPIPSSAPIHGAAIAPPIEMASKPARISGLPIAGTPENRSEDTNEARPGAAAAGITEPAGGESGTTASSATFTGTIASGAEPATEPERAIRPSRAVSRTTPVNEYAVDSNAVETVDIPASPSLNDDSADQPDSSQNIWVKQQEATVSPIDSMLLAAYEAIQRGQYEDARSFYVRVLARDADSVDALLGMAAIS